MSHYLTTPIAYMNGGLPDVFNKVEENPDDRYLVAWGPDYFFGTADGSPTEAGKSAWGPRLKNFPMYSNGTVLSRTKFFFMFSLGPDQKYDVLTPAWPSPVEQYDATNGTVSKGDLVRING